MQSFGLVMFLQYVSKNIYKTELSRTASQYHLIIVAYPHYVQYHHKIYKNIFVHQH